MEQYNRLSPEFALVQALEVVPALRGRTNALQPQKGIRPPFAFYVSSTDDEEQALDGDTGLQQYTAAVHLVAESYRGLLLLCSLARKAITDMRGTVYSTPDSDVECVPRGKILVENAVLTQLSPDLYEGEVGYYRRVFTVRLDYQTEEVFTDDD